MPSVLLFLYLIISCSKKNVSTQNWCNWRALFPLIPRKKKKSRLKKGGKVLLNGILIVLEVITFYSLEIFKLIVESRTSILYSEGIRTLHSLDQIVNQSVFFCLRNSGLVFFYRNISPASLRFAFGMFLFNYCR